MKNYKKRKKIIKGTNLLRKTKEKEYWPLIVISLIIHFSTTGKVLLFTYYIGNIILLIIHKHTVSKWQTQEDLQPYLPDIIALI